MPFSFDSWRPNKPKKPKVPLELFDRSTAGPYRNYNTANYNATNYRKSLNKPKSDIKGVAKRRKGRFVEYHLVGPKLLDEWKLIKDLTEEESEACRQFRFREEQKINEIKWAAKEYAEQTANGSIPPSPKYSLTVMEPFLAEELNQAHIRVGKDIGDWGNVKPQVSVYCDAPLIRAVRKSGIRTVLALLRTGLCDPTLECCPHEFIDVRCAPNDGDIIETALSVAKSVTEKLRKGGDTCLKSNVPLRNATQIEAIIEAALSMWPRVNYSSYDAGSSYEDERKVRKFKNRMVKDEDSRIAQTAALRELMDTAKEECLSGM